MNSLLLRAKGSGFLTPVRTGIPDTTTVGNTGNFVGQDINGLVYGSAWDTTKLTYSFPTSVASYGAGYPDQSALNGFQALNAAQQGVVLYAFSLTSQYASLTFTDVPSTSTTHATIRLAGSSFPSASYTYYPAATNDGGDVFYGNIRNDAATKAGYVFDTILHEIGHSLGLKHGQDNDGTHGVLPAGHNSTEWPVMDYHSYIGGDSSYDNSANYSANLAIDLRPGEWSTFSTGQLANLDAEVPGVDVAPGNIIDANQYNNDARSLIDNAYGGSGNDTPTGNSAGNLSTGVRETTSCMASGGTASQYMLTLSSSGNYTIVKPGGTDQLHAIDLLQFDTSAPVAIDTLLNRDPRRRDPYQAVSLTSGVGRFSVHLAKAET